MRHVTFTVPLQFTAQYKLTGPRRFKLDRIHFRDPTPRNTDIWTSAKQLFPTFRRNPQICGRTGRRGNAAPVPDLPDSTRQRARSFASSFVVQTTTRQPRIAAADRVTLGRTAVVVDRTFTFVAATPWRNNWTSAGQSHTRLCRVNRRNCWCVWNVRACCLQPLICVCVCVWRSRLSLSLSIFRCDRVDFCIWGMRGMRMWRIGSIFFVYAICGGKI